MAKTKTDNKEKKKGLLARFVSFYKPHKKLFAIDMICAFVISVFNLVYPYITKEIINNYVPNKLLNLLLVGAGVLLAVYSVKALLNYVLQYWGHLVGVRIQADMRSRLFEKLQRLPFSYFDNNKTGVIMSRMTNDLFEIAELAHHGPEDVFLSLVTIVGAFVMLATINIPLALIVFAFIPIIVVFTMLMRNRMNKVFEQMRKVQGEINADVESAVSGIRVTRAYASAKHDKEKFEKGNAEFVKARSRQYKVMGEFFSVMTFLLDILYFAVLLAGGLFFYYGKIDTGEFAAFVLYISALITPIRTLTTIYEQIQDGATGFRRFCDIMDEPEEEEKENALQAECLRGDIVFDNVSFAYKNDENSKKVISGFSMSIAAGKTVALVGPSGGGKTTLCHLLPRFYDVDGGSITVDGCDVRDFTLASLRKNIGIVQQDVFLFNGTIGENIAYGNFDADFDSIVEAAKRANIHEHIMSLPDGYDTSVGERGVNFRADRNSAYPLPAPF